MTRLELAIDQIVGTRTYTVELLDATPTDQWFRQPPAGVSHVAWQVGHLACAEYRLALWRTRGQRPQDDDLISERYIQLFGYGSVPDPDPGRYPSPAEIVAVLHRVHEQTLGELRGMDEGDMDQPVVHPHPQAKTKVQAILWCARHEMLHVGQIGLLRRQLGHPPL
jgi:hypothetical protein